MLSSLISKNDCKNCRFCCVFKRTSLWEVPSFPGETLKRVSKETHNSEVIMNKGEKCSYGHFDLSKCYTSNDENEEVACPCLDEQTGCTLSEDFKPFECQLWPFRVMNKDGKNIIAVSIHCPAIMKWECEWLRSFADSNLKAPVKEFIAQNPNIIKDFQKGYLALLEI